MNNQIVNNLTYHKNLLSRLVQEGVIEEVTADNEALAERLVITSAVELSEEDVERIVRLVVQKLAHPLKQIVTNLNTKLISGVRAQSESFYFEISGQKTLRDIKRLINESFS